ncbi:uncharacterized protein [Onthophagus taurus]|uniref:uncharacterized protein n=1 Tax=Onthophagus taurus TaxID=166361 RepID=UPI000C206FF9|nr:uncharacterized protein LOC111427194 [Onthophagus taurus]
MSSVSLPPVPDLIPISRFQLSNVKGGGKRRFEVMGEQRSRRTAGIQPAVDLIDTARSRGPSHAQTPFPKSRPERHRKSERRREHRRARKRAPSKQSGTLEDRPVNPRVNPIFVWVRQEDTQIVDVKCEDYDKRNRILLTKTAQGWRAIPRTETLVPTLKDDKGKTTDTHHQSDLQEEPPRLRKQRKTHKVKRRSTGVQVGDDGDDISDAETRIPSPPISWDDPVNVESHLPSHTIRIPKKDVNKTCDVSPLDNLLAVAELELQSNDWGDKCTDTTTTTIIEKPKSPSTETDIELDKFIDSCNPSYDDSIQKNPDESDYNTEDDNNLAMDDILNRLEQSLRSPETQTDIIPPDTKKESDILIKTPEDDEIVVIPDDEPDVPTDLSTKKDEDQPTDLSLPKRNKSPLSRPPSHSSETIQSPQPSGIPAVPPSPDILQNQKSKFLESLLQKTQEPEKEPLDLNFRKSASPTVTCSEEVKSSKEPEPPSKKLKVEDITLKRLLDVQVESTKSDTSKIKETSRLLELLSCPIEQDPVAQLNQVLTDNTINIPDPLLVPKNRLSQILSSPAREIPRLLIDRPELRLPQALAFPHLLQDPDILVITIQQLQTIVQKQSQLPLKEGKEEIKQSQEEKKEIVAKPPTPKANENNNVSKEEKSKDKKAGMNELANDIDAASNAAFNQMMWLPYFNQMENNPNSEFLKLLAMSYSHPHPPDMAHLLGMNRFMPPSAFSMQPPSFPNPMEYNWQEMVMMRPKNQYDLYNKNMYKEYVEKSKKSTSNNKPSGKSNYMFPPSLSSFHQTPNPLLNMPPFTTARPNLHVPQFNPNHQSSRLSTSSSRNNRGYTQKSSHFGHVLASGKSEEKKTSPSTNKVTSQQKFEAPGSVPKHSGMQPIDLSGSTASGSKLKVRQHLIDPGHAARMLKQDDVPEVGSTTASIEEMQDAQKYLWHPLFGNQKNYTSPWNWTTVTAAGE